MVESAPPELPEYPDELKTVFKAGQRAAASKMWHLAQNEVLNGHSAAEVILCFQVMCNLLSQDIDAAPDEVLRLIRETLAHRDTHVINGEVDHGISAG